MKKKNTEKAAPPATVAPERSLEAAIAERAYGLWEAEGRPAGREDRHWLQAEREILEERGESPRGGIS